MIVLGCISGIFLKNGTISFELIEVKFYEISIVLLVIDVLIYQARYQLNDIRGLKADLQAGRKDRLPVGSKGSEHAVRTSLIILLEKIAVAFFLIIVAEPSVRSTLLICTIMILVSTILYEWARTIKSDIGVFMFVSFGYPIRFFAGMWVVWPEMWKDELNWMGTSIPSGVIVFMILVSFAFLGEFSAILPWTHEAIYQMKKYKTIVSKSHHI